MPECKEVYINGKKRKAVWIRGRLYVRKGFSLPIEHCERFENKCDAFTEDEAKIMEKLALEFTHSRGHWDSHPEMKDAGDLYDRNVKNYIRSAVKKVAQNLLPTGLFGRN